MPSNTPITDHLFAIRWALERAEQEPVTTRIRLYRGIASITGDPAEKSELLAHADSLESADARCREFRLTYPRAVAQRKPSTR